MEDVTIKFLEQIHTLSVRAANISATIDLLLDAETFQGIPTDTMKAMLNEMQTVTNLQSHVLKLLTEHQMMLEEKIDQHIAKLNKK